MNSYHVNHIYIFVYRVCCALEGKMLNLDDDSVSGNTGNKTRHRKWGLGRSFRRTSSKKKTDVRSDSGLSIGRVQLNDGESGYTYERSLYINFGTFH